MFKEELIKSIKENKTLKLDIAMPNGKVFNKIMLLCEQVNLDRLENENILISNTAFELGKYTQSLPFDCITTVYNKSDNILTNKPNIDYQTPREKDEILLKHKKFEFLSDEVYKDEEIALIVAKNKNFDLIPTSLGYQKDKDFIRKICENKDAANSTLYCWMDNSLKADIQFLEELNIDFEKPSFSFSTNNIPITLLKDFEYFKYMFKKLHGHGFSLELLSNTQGKNMYSKEVIEFFKKNKMIFQYNDDVVTKDFNKQKLFCSKESIFKVPKAIDFSTVDLEDLKLFLKNIDASSFINTNIFSAYKILSEEDIEVIKKLQTNKNIRQYIEQKNIKYDDIETLSILSTYNHLFLTVMSQDSLKDFLECEASECKNIDFKDDQIIYSTEYFNIIIDKEKITLYALATNDYSGQAKLIFENDTDISKMLIELFCENVEKINPGLKNFLLKDKNKDLTYNNLNFNILGSYKSTKEKINNQNTELPFF